MDFSWMQFARGAKNSIRSRMKRGIFKRDREMQQSLLEKSRIVCWCLKMARGLVSYQRSHRHCCCNFFRSHTFKTRVGLSLSPLFLYSLCLFLFLTSLPSLSLGRKGKKD